MSEKVKLFIGTSSNGEDALIEMAYEYSLRKETDRDLEIVWMRQTNDSIRFGTDLLISDGQLHSQVFDGLSPSIVTSKVGLFTLTLIC